MKIISTLLLVFSLQSQASWDLNDVSYLMPLPSSVEAQGLLRLDSPGRGGVLLSPKIAQQIPVLAIDRSREEIEASLRVLAVRIDPCFPLPTPQSCQRQIRLVWQPVEVNNRQQIQSVDAALHSFHVLKDWEFAGLLQDLASWKKKFSVETGYKPLQIHPAWSAEGESSQALVEFNQIIMKYAGMENFTRVTAMVLRGNADMWAFAGFEPRDGRLQMLKVPRLGDRLSQAFINLAVPADHFAGGGISPIAKGPDTFNNLVAESIRLGEGEDKEDLILKEVRAAFRVESPKNFNPENMDCVSCHVAQPAIHWVLNKRPELQAEKVWSSEIYQNMKYDLSNTSPEVWNTQQIRGFGYFGRNAAISQRVINESAEVADAINRILASRQERQR